MDRATAFSYQCNKCGRCCHGQVITLSPYDVQRLARAARISTSEAIARFTIRRGSILKFRQYGSCTALMGPICTLHSGRPLACRLYPLGLEYVQQSGERYMNLEPALGSRGIYGEHGSVQGFLQVQGAELYLQANRQYAALLGIFRARITEISDFDVVEPREFWRVARREALAEKNFDFNPIIEALFDSDSCCCRAKPDFEFIDQHIKEIERRIRTEHDAAVLAAAAVMLAVSLGYPPQAVMIGCRFSSSSSDCT